MDGIRTSKTVDGIKTTYQYIGGQLQYEKKGNIEIHYLYDANGIIKVIRTVDGSGNVKDYYVITNSRGDVTQIYDDLGILQAAYTYDAWGRILSIKDSPFSPMIIDLKGLFSGWGKYFKFSVPVPGILFGNKKGEEKAKNRDKNGKVIDKSKVSQPRKNNNKEKGKMGSLNKKGEANSSTELYNDKGELIQRRYYDGNGDVEYDIDFSHGGNHEFPHIHYWK